MPFRGKLEYLGSQFSSVQSLSHRWLFATPCNGSTSGFPVHHHLPPPPPLAQTHVHRVGDAIQTSHPLSSPFPPVFNLSHHQDLFQWVSSSHQVAKFLVLQLQHQFFQWIFRTEYLYYWLVESHCSPRDSQGCSPTPQFQSTLFYLDDNSTTVWWFLPYPELAWISQDAHVSTYPELPIHLPPHPIPLGCPRAPALSALFHALNLHWSSILNMVIHMFQCFSLKSSYPCPLPHSQKSILYICVSFAALHIGSSFLSF